MKREMKASEALYGFCAWLTVRDERTVMNAKKRITVTSKYIDKMDILNKLNEMYRKTHKVQLQSNEYKCANCGVIFKREWNDKEAILECKKNFPDGEMENCDIICDDCYKLIMATINN